MNELVIPAAKRIFSARYIFFAFFVLLAGAAVFLWSQSENLFRTWVLLCFLAVLCCGSVFFFGNLNKIAIAPVFLSFMLLLSVSLHSFNASSKASFLSRKEIMKLKLSEIGILSSSGCTGFYSDPQMSGHSNSSKGGNSVGGDDATKVKEFCEFLAKKKAERQKQ